MGAVGYEKRIEEFVIPVQRIVSGGKFDQHPVFCIRPQRRRRQYHVVGLENPLHLLIVDPDTANPFARRLEIQHDRPRRRIAPPEMNDRPSSDGLARVIGHAK